MGKKEVRATLGRVARESLFKGLGPDHEPHKGGACANVLGL